jgi:ribonuclease D
LSTAVTIPKSPSLTTSQRIVAFLRPPGYEGPSNLPKTVTMTIRYHKGDLPDLLLYGERVAIDTETLGLNLARDRLCVVQLSPGDGSADVVQIAPGQRAAPNLTALLSDARRIKIFHYARFDIGFLFKTFGVMTNRVYCTKIASKLTRTYTDRHGLKDLCKDLLDIDLNKQQQSTDWAAETLSEAQLAYAASDVIYLHALKAELDRRLLRERRSELADACFGFLPARSLLDLAGWEEDDIFAH